MINRLLFWVLFSVCCGSCSAEVGKSDSDESLERAILSFSDSVSGDDVSKFNDIVGAKGILLVRKFTSGNLGGRGKELSDTFSASAINSKMEFPIKGQTPFSLKLLFPGLPAKSFTKSSQYTLPIEACDLPFDQWNASLKTTIAPLSEAVNGEAIILKADAGCWIYAEAQLIDDILVGGFAVFTREGDEVYLVSIIDLL